MDSFSVYAPNRHAFRPANPQSTNCVILPHSQFDQPFPAISLMRHPFGVFVSRYPVSDSC